MQICLYIININIKYCIQQVLFCINISIVIFDDKIMSIYLNKSIYYSEDHSIKENLINTFDNIYCKNKNLSYN